MENPKKTIVMLLRSQMADLDRRRITALGNLAAVGAVEGSPSSNQLHDAARLASKAYEDMKAAYHYAVNQFIENRQWDVSIGDCTYTVPASTATDACLLASALDETFEPRKYRNNAVIDGRDVRHANSVGVATPVQPEM